MHVQTLSIKATPEFYQASRGDHERAFPDEAAPSRNAREICRSLPVPLPLPDLGRRGCGAVAVGGVAEVVLGDGRRDNVSPPGVGDRLVNVKNASGNLVPTHGRDYFSPCSSSANIATRRMVIAQCEVWLTDLADPIGSALGYRRCGSDRGPAVRCEGRGGDGVRHALFAHPPCLVNPRGLRVRSLSEEWACLLQCGPEAPPRAATGSRAPARELPRRSML